MLQVKDPQEVFDELIRPDYEATSADLAAIDEKAAYRIINSVYQVFVLGEMYGTISTCLAQNIPIPKELWDMPVVQSFVRGDVDDVTFVGKYDDILSRVPDVEPEYPDEPINEAIANTTEDQWAKVAESARQDIAEAQVDLSGAAYNSAVEKLRAKGIIIP